LEVVVVILFFLLLVGFVEYQISRKANELNPPTYNTLAQTSLQQQVDQLQQAVERSRQETEQLVNRPESSGKVFLKQTAIMNYSEIHVLNHQTPERAYTPWYMELSGSITIPKEQVLTVGSPISIGLLATQKSDRRCTFSPTDDNNNYNFRLSSLNTNIAPYVGNYFAQNGAYFELVKGNPEVGRVYHFPFTVVSEIEERLENGKVVRDYSVRGVSHTVIAINYHKFNPDNDNEKSTPYLVGEYKLYEVSPT
jgi:hypothetical protein